MFACSTAPSRPTRSSTSTVPCQPCRLARAGYSGVGQTVQRARRSPPPPPPPRPSPCARPPPALTPSPTPSAPDAAPVPASSTDGNRIASSTVGASAGAGSTACADTRAIVRERTCRGGRAIAGGALTGDVISRGTTSGAAAGACASGRTAPAGPFPIPLSPTTLTTIARSATGERTVPGRSLSARKPAAWQLSEKPSAARTRVLVVVSRLPCKLPDPGPRKGKPGRQTTDPRAQLATLPLGRPFLALHPPQMSWLGDRPYVTAFPAAGTRRHPVA